MWLKVYKSQLFCLEFNLQEWRKVWAQLSTGVGANVKKMPNLDLKIRAFVLGELEIGACCY